MRNCRHMIPTLILGSAISITLAPACTMPFNSSDATYETVSPLSLAACVRESYARARKLEFDAYITHAEQKIVCTVTCRSDGFLHVEVTMPSAKLVYVLDQTPDNDGRLHIQERNLVTGRRDDCIVTKQEIDKGQWDIRCGAGLGFDPCLIGGYLSSWAGPDTHRSKFFSDVISVGEYRGMSKLAEDTCYVIATNRPQRPGEEIWIDVRSGFVRRWRDPIRDRIYDYKSSNDSAPLASEN